MLKIPGPQKSAHAKLVVQPAHSAKLVISASAARTRLPSDFLDEADLRQATSSPLSAQERQALMAVAMPPGDSCRADSLAEILCDTGAVHSDCLRDPSSRFLSIINCPKTAVSGFIGQWLQSELALIGEADFNEMFPAFLRAVQFTAEVEDWEFARSLGVSQAAALQWMSPGLNLPRKHKIALLRRLARTLGHAG